MRGKADRIEKDCVAGPAVILRVPTLMGTPRWLRFHHPRKVYIVRRLDRVKPVLRELADLIDRGAYIAGYIAYEAASAFDPAFVTRRPVAGLPLLWFGVYDRPEQILAIPGDPVAPGARDDVQQWQATLAPADYRRALSRIRRYIAAGDTYQVNYTFRLRTPMTINPWRLFRAMYAAQPVPYAAFVDTGHNALVSLSPELFFQRKGDIIGPADEGYDHARGRVGR